MGRITFEEARQYEKEPCYFTLSNDGDSVKVKFLFDSLRDIYQYMVHSVKYNGKYYKVDCLRESPADSVDKCPICNSGVEPFKKFYIPLFNLTEDKFQYWERGKTFSSKLVRLCEEYYPVSDEVFEIERVGAKGDRDTDYRITNITDEYVNGKNAKQLDFGLNDLDVPDCMDPEAGIVLDKGFSELEYYVNNGIFEDDTFDYSSSRDRDTDNIANRYNKRRNGFKDSYSSNYRTRSSYSSRRNHDDEYDDDSYESRTSSRKREF